MEDFNPGEIPKKKFSRMEEFLEESAEEFLEKKNLGGKSAEIPWGFTDENLWRHIWGNAKKECINILE